MLMGKHSLAKRAVTAALVALLAFDGMPAPALAEAITTVGAEGTVVLDADATDDAAAEGAAVVMPETDGFDDQGGAGGATNPVDGAEETSDEETLPEEPAVIEDFEPDGGADEGTLDVQSSDPVQEITETDDNQSDIEEQLEEDSTDTTKVPDEEEPVIEEAGKEDASSRRATLSAKATANGYKAGSNGLFDFDFFDIRSIYVEVSCSNKAYTGKTIKPNPTVTWLGVELDKGIDYTLSYPSSNYVSCGKKSITIKGKGLFTGTRTVTFRITKRTVTSSSVAKVGNKTYTGKAIKPKPTVKVAGRTLKLNSDYTLSYQNNTKVGTATIIVKGKGNYQGVARRTFKIVRAAQKSISNAKISGYKSSYTYTGKAIKPTVTVKYGSTTLKKGTHYTVSYGKNTSVGTGTITIKGKGAYKGSKKVTFRIVKKASTAYYKLKRDTWRFENPSLTTPLEFCKKFYGTSQGTALYNNARLYESGGQCFGMATTVGAIRKYGYPSAKSFHSGSTYASNLYQVSKGWVSTSNGLSAQDYVRYGQIAQFESSLSAEGDRNYENYSGLVSAVRNSVTGGTPIVICLYDYSGSGHAVFPIGIKSNTSASTVISIYDSNFPTEAQTLTLYKSNGSYTKRYSFSGDRWGWNLNYLSWETPCDNMDDLFARQHDVSSGWLTGNTRYTLYALSADMKATIGGKEYDLSADRGYDNELIVPVQNINGATGSDTHLYWIRDDAGEVTFAGINEDATITVAAQTGGVEATVEAGSEVAVNVENFDDNGVTVSGEEGDEFSVRFFDDDGRGGLDETTVSGTVDEDQKVEATQDGDDIEVTGAEDVVEQ